MAVLLSNRGWLLFLDKYEHIVLKSSVLIYKVLKLIVLRVRFYNNNNKKKKKKIIINNNNNNTDFFLFHTPFSSVPYLYSYYPCVYFYLLCASAYVQPSYNIWMPSGVINDDD